MQDSNLKTQNSESSPGKEDERGAIDAHMLHYRLGNAYYQKGDWKEAIQHYMEACELNSESPAREKLKMTYEILDFYNKDVYGQ